MTSEEIKASISMTELISRYGLRPDRAGFIRCPFHKGDREPSMKIYKDSYYCFGCGASGDIFAFVMQMDGKGFKDAFRQLGGEYEAHSRRSEITGYHRKHRAEEPFEDQESHSERVYKTHLAEYLRRNENMKKYEPWSRKWSLELRKRTVENNWLLNEREVMVRGSG